MSIFRVRAGDNKFIKKAYNFIDFLNSTEGALNLESDSMKSVVIVGDGFSVPPLIFDDNKKKDSTDSECCPFSYYICQNYFPAIFPTTGTFT